MDDEEPPKLKEIFIQNYFGYLKYSRDMMLDGPDCKNEYNYLGHTVRRANSENNIWDVIWEYEDEDKKPALLNSVNVDRFETANDLANKLAKIAGVEFGDEGDIEEFEDLPASPAFR